MTLLILGLLIWSSFHLFPILAPQRRQAVAARLGEGPWKAVFALVIVASVVLMVVGYRGADIDYLYFPPPWTVHLNNLLMVFAVFLFGASHSKGNVKRFVRHPMLLSVIVWSVAHLMVRGDLASVVLFGGLGIWAVVSIFATNARDGAWVKPAPAPFRKDLILVAITIVAFIVIVTIHGLIGPSPFRAG